jgi:hypothetical protein
MRVTLGLCALLFALPSWEALAQPQPRPHGSYERQCTDIHMSGQFLSATCRGARGGGQSSINVLSCSSDIGVDATGALSCTGPGAPAPAPAYRQGQAPDLRRGYESGPAYGPADRSGYEPRRGYGERRPYGQEAVTLFGGRNFRGRSVRIDGPAPNLGSTGMNDRVRSIRLDRRSGPWIVCTDAEYRGRCMTIADSLGDTRLIGMGDAISSLRPAR